MLPSTFGWLAIFLGQAPAAGRISLRTVPRNFPGRSGTREDSVYLCSPETATASALTGVITDPRDLGLPYERIKEPEHFVFDTSLPLADGSNTRHVAAAFRRNLVLQHQRHGASLLELPASPGH
jgi:hypothetical protein